jgi:DNA-binding NarL/FixJ family response regulator
MAWSDKMETRPQILIADDHLVFAEGLRLLLEKRYTVVGIVADGRALISEALRLNPDLIITDIGMPLLNGLDAAKRLRQRLPNVRVIFLTMQDDPNLAAATLELGSAGFVLKHSAGSELLKAIDHVLRGKPFVTPKLRPEDWVKQKVRARHYSTHLTPRQREIVQMCAEGRPLKEIAGRLDLSEKTIQFHKYHIMETFNLKSNADLVLFAIKEGLVSLDPIPQKQNPLS